MEPELSPQMKKMIEQQHIFSAELEKIRVMEVVDHHDVESLTTSITQILNMEVVDHDDGDSITSLLATSIVIDAEKIAEIYGKISDYYASNIQKLETLMVKCDDMISHYGEFEKKVQGIIDLLSDSVLANKIGLCIIPVFTIDAIQKHTSYFYNSLQKLSHDKLDLLIRSIPDDIYHAQAKKMLDWPDDLPKENICKYIFDLKPTDHFNASRYEAHVRARMRLCYLGNLHNIIFGTYYYDAIAQAYLIVSYLEKNREIRHTRNYKIKDDSEHTVMSYTMTKFNKYSIISYPDKVSTVVNDIVRILKGLMNYMKEYKVFQNSDRETHQKIMKIIDSMVFIKWFIYCSL